jgi:hypothetical protein
MGAFGVNACHNLAGYLFASACHFWTDGAPIVCVGEMVIFWEAGTGKDDNPRS